MKHARQDYNRIQDPEGLIPDDEPVFLIRGQDICAPDVLRFYAETAKANGASDELVQATLRQADLMDDWHVDQCYKVPDLTTHT